jgi:hypothetical protein
MAGDAAGRGEMAPGAGEKAPWTAAGEVTPAPMGDTTPDNGTGAFAGDAVDEASAGVPWPEWL